MRKLFWCVFLVGCGGGNVSSEDEAAMAYLGLDTALDRALGLGLQGFNAADSANLDPQTGAGDETGTMTITGQADQGASDNKGLRLEVALVDYSDLVDVDEDEDEEVSITYDTDPEAPLPAFDLQLRNIPNGTLEGTIGGAFIMSGDLEGPVTLALDVTATIEDDGSGGVVRTAGSTHVTGIATTSSGGEFTVDVTK
jgi:hypothetical protein